MPLDPGPTASTDTTPGRAPCIDGLRALAATAVLVFHVSYLTYAGKNWLASATLRLDTGVSVFLVISGFLIFRPFARGVLTGDLPALRPYLLRRAARIYPGYWLALVALLALGWVQVHGWKAATANSLLIQSYFPFTTGIPVINQAWTLVIEVTFYALAPVVALACHLLGRYAGRIRALLSVTAGLILAGYAVEWWPALAAHPRPYRIWVQLVPFYLPMLGWGMLLAVAAASAELGSQPPRRLRALADRAGVCWAIAGAAFLALWALHGRRPVLDTTIAQASLSVTLQSFVGLFLVLPAAMGDQARGAIRRGLTARPVVFVGTISYGIYLWHLAIIDQLKQQLVRWRGTFFTLSLTAFAASAAIAALSWFVLERPVLRLAHRRARPVGTNDGDQRGRAAPITLP